MLEIGIMVAGLIFSVIGYLLRKKDEEQGRQIDMLFTESKSNARETQDLRLRIAQDHYHKNELDARFLRLEATFQKGFDDLGHKFDRLSETFAHYATRRRDGE